nr:putative ribonuclease H-like domain-containing protein [Tanacetum cinerariifolium]
NRIEFKNGEMNQFYEMKGILRQFSVARTPQQNRVAERRNKTLIKAGSRPDWLFDIDALTRTMNYKTIVARTQSNYFTDLKSSHDNGFKPSSDEGKKVNEVPGKGNKCNDQEKEDNVNSTNNVHIVSSIVNVAGTNEDNELTFDPNMHALEDVGTFDFSNEDEDDDDIVADMNNMDTTIQVSPVPTTRIHKDHPFDQVIGDLHLATQM